MRKQYGSTWWGQRWLNALQHIDYSNRLPRGRTYANKGLATNIQIDEGHITAEVQGSRYLPYDVELDIPPLSKKEITELLGLIADSPFFQSKLLNRELPSSLYDVCVARGIELFPSSWHDLDGSCSCPDWAVPCKHMAAVIYLLVNEIDKNPFLIFSFRSVDLFAAVEAMQTDGHTGKALQIPTLSQFYENRKPKLTSASAPVPPDLSLLPDCLPDWQTILPDTTTFFPEGDFKKRLLAHYRSVAKESVQGRVFPVHVDEAALRPKPGQLPEYAAVEKATLVLDQGGDFSRLELLDGLGQSVGTIERMPTLLYWLAAVPFAQISHFAKDVQALYFAYRLSRKLLEQSAYIPQLLQLDQLICQVRWIPALLKPQVRQACEQLLTFCSDDLVTYRIHDQPSYPILTDWACALLSPFLNYAVWSWVREELDLLVIDLFFAGEFVVFDDFHNREYPSAIYLWLHRLYLGERSIQPVLQIEDAKEGFKLRLGVVQKDKKGQPPISLPEFLSQKKHQSQRSSVLRDLSSLTNYFPPLEKLINTQGEQSLFFDGEAFVDVLLKMLPIIELLGISVQMPKSLRRLIRPSLSLRLNTMEGDTKVSSGLVSLQNLLDFQWQVAIGDQGLTAAEFEQLAATYSGIVKWKDQYVLLTDKETSGLLRQLEKPPRLKTEELLQVTLTEEYAGSPVQLSPAARQLMKKISATTSEKVPAGLLATLRPYQLRGYSWLYKNARLGFGSLLADDMGLGKTLQVITTLLRLKRAGAFRKQKALIVAPTTLLTNWLKEIEKFAPSLQTHLYHGSNRSFPVDEKSYDLLLTTYGVIRTEVQQLSQINWEIIVIDEAQAIKNPAAAQTKALKKLRAPLRIAMSGTPVENRLAEFWSILDFTNEGLLGNLSHFSKTFAKPIEAEQNQQKMDLFRRLTAPFILRRLKTDRSIISDLPAKVEQEEFCTLTAEQAALYQDVVEQHWRKLEQAEGIERSGLVFSLMTALKQICNHPRHYLKDGPNVWARSGKTQRLHDLLQQILAQDEKVLIFTQYREMGEMLAAMIGQEFDLPEIPFLHGGCSRKQRDAMVEDFQANRARRVFILSLKAGGTGLNLTAASRVIHFDLWWNPAVEQQATDRAYRIGQQKNVFVHRMITQHTFEEKINQMMYNKRDLADQTVATGEKWIGDLSDRELKELVSL